MQAQKMVTTVPEKKVDERQKKRLSNSADESIWLRAGYFRKIERE